jgi:hypothetical protein
MNVITAIAQMLSEKIQQELTSEYTLTDIEPFTHRLVMEIGRQAIEVVVNNQEKPYPEPEVPCPQCDQTIPYVRQRPAQMRTLL